MNTNGDLLIDHNILKLATKAIVLQWEQAGSKLSGETAGFTVDNNCKTPLLEKEEKYTTVGLIPDDATDSVTKKADLF